MKALLEILIASSVIGGGLSLLIAYALSRWIIPTRLKVERPDLYRQLEVPEATWMESLFISDISSEMERYREDTTPGDSVGLARLKKISVWAWRIPLLAFGLSILLFLLLIISIVLGVIEG